MPVIPALLPNNLGTYLPHFYYLQSSNFLSSIIGEIAVVDLDAALGRGNNKQVILELIKSGAQCRVGGGIRDVETALFWLNEGAVKVVLGTAATPEVLSKLPKERVIAALDAVHGEVVVHGWTTKTGKSVKEQIVELKPFVSGFLVTFVEREGKMEGVDLQAIKEVSIKILRLYLN